MAVVFFSKSRRRRTRKKKKKNEATFLHRHVTHRVLLWCASSMGLQITRRTMGIRQLAVSCLALWIRYRPSSHKIMKVQFIVGLPGSGKTYLAKSYLATNLQFSKNWKLYDDPVDLAKMIQDVKNGWSLIVTDPHLCWERNRSIAQILMENAGAEVEWTFFENNPAACKRNVVKRNDNRRVDSFIDLLSKNYVVPTGVINCEVYKGDEETA
jgi:hypothetical protein